MMAFAISVPPLAEAGQTLLPDPPKSTKGLKQLALIQSQLTTLGAFPSTSGKWIKAIVSGAELAENLFTTFVSSKNV